MTIETKLQLWKIIRYVAPALGALMILISSLIIDSLESKKKLEDNVNAEISKKKEKDDLIKGIKAINEDRTSNSLPGFTITTMLTIANVKESKRKFIYDCGGLDYNRFSLYMDANNNLVYRIIDQHGEHHTLQIPQHLHTFKAKEPMIVLVDFGHSEKYSFMRLFINNREIDRKEFNYCVDYNFKDNSKNMVIFSDLTKHYFGTFTIGFYRIGHETFTDKMRNDHYLNVEKLMEDFNRV